MRTDSPIEVGAEVEWRPTSLLRSHPEAGQIPALSREEKRAFLADIGRRGVLVALEITAEGVILDGRERFRAAAELGIEQLAVRVIAADDELEYMLLAALRRRHLDASRKAALALRLSDYQQKLSQGRGRRQQNLRQNQIAEAATLPLRDKKTRDELAELAGVSARTAQDVLTVQEHAPELLPQIEQGALPAHRAARRVRRQHLRDSAPPQPPLPHGVYDLFYVDPPWQMDTLEIASGPEDHYPTMTLDEIKALPIPAADQAVLFLWRVTSLAREALEVLDAWGFDYRAEIVWVKPSIGPGVWVRHRHETLLIATRGGHPIPERERCPDSVIEAPRRRHSQKPDQFYELIEAAYPHATRLELFARGRPRPGWTTWGNQADKA